MYLLPEGMTMADVLTMDSELLASEEEAKLKLTNNLVLTSEEKPDA